MYFIFTIDLQINYTYYIEIMLICNLQNIILDIRIWSSSRLFVIELHHLYLVTHYIILNLQCMYS